MSKYVWYGATKIPFGIYDKKDLIEILVNESMYIIWFLRQMCKYLNFKTVIFTKSLTFCGKCSKLED